MTELKAGESVQANITKSLSYTVTNNDWSLRVSSTKNLAVRPNADGSVQIVCVDVPEEDEV